MAARAALFFSTYEGMISSPSMPLGKQMKSHVRKALPVLQPTVFPGDNMEGWTIVRRRRWSPASDANVRDPRKKEVSNFRVVGQVGLLVVSPPDNGLSF
jgi:hypothetical protein